MVPAETDTAMRSTAGVGFGVSQTNRAGAPRQRHWRQALEEALRIWGDVPEEVLVDNAKALVTHHNPRTVELVINPVFATFARHWGFTAKACWPNRPQTKGKDELRINPLLIAALDRIASGRFRGGDRMLFEPLLSNLRHHDPFLVLADAADYSRSQTAVDVA
jgi:hypothetical protein